MILADANVLIYAFRRDTDRHEEFKNWLENALNNGVPFGYSEQVLSLVIHITTHPKIFVKPSSLAAVLEYTEFIRAQPASLPVNPGNGHGDIFTKICHQSMAKGNLIADAWFAALAIEHRLEWITADRDFARFPGLKWRHPLDGN